MSLVRVGKQPKHILAILNRRFYGGPSETRTRHLLLARQALSQMSYGPVYLVGERGSDISQATSSSVALLPTLRRVIVPGLRTRLPVLTFQ